MIYLGQYSLFLSPTFIKLISDQQDRNLKCYRHSRSSFFIIFLRYSINISDVNWCKKNLLRTTRTKLHCVRKANFAHSHLSIDFHTISYKTSLCSSNSTGEWRMFALLRFQQFLYIGCYTRHSSVLYVSLLLVRNIVFIAWTHLNVEIGF